MGIKGDVLIVGGGIAGLTCAVAVARAGWAVRVLERGQDAQYLCNSRLTQGVVHCALADPLEPVDVLARKIDANVQGEGDPDLRDSLAKDVLRAVRFLQSCGVRFLKGPFHYQSFVLSPPSVTTLGRSWKGRGGDAMLRHLEARLNAFGGEILRGHAAETLLLESGRVWGVTGHRADGTAFGYRADHTVICDGGAQGGLDLMAQQGWQSPERVHQRNAGTSDGSGVKMVREAGGAITALDRFYGHLVSVDAPRIPALAHYPFLDYVMSAAILVSSAGLRILDEGKGGIPAANHLARQERPDDAFVIVDDIIWKERGRFRLMSPNPVLADNGGQIFTAESLAELAQAAGIEPAALEATVAAYNAAVAAGLSQDLDPPRSLDEGPAWPILQPPFHAIPVVPGITYTMGGIKIDAASRVLRPDGSVLGGLLAAGCTTGGLEGGGDRGGYIGGLSRSIVTALRAAEAISGDYFTPPPSPRGPKGELLIRRTAQEALS